MKNLFNEIMNRQVIRLLSDISKITLICDKG